MTNLPAAHDFYESGRLSVLCYDVLESIGRPPAPEVAFYRDFAMALRTPILEIGCGTGRISWPLAEAGQALVGVDLSEAMLAQARGKAGRYPQEVSQRIRFIAGDLRTLELGTTHELVLAPHRIFNAMLTRADQQAFLATLRRHLQPGGRAIFDTTRPDPDWLLDGRDPASHVNTFVFGDQRLEHRIAGKAVELSDQRFTLDIRYTLRAADGTILGDHVNRLRQRWIDRPDMHDLLDQAGFRRVAEYQGFDRSPPQAVGDCVWVVEPV